MKRGAWYGAPGAAALVAAFVLLAGAPGPVAAQEPEAGLVLDSVVVRGNVRQPTAVVIATSGLRTGATIDARDVQAAIRRLWATGEYADVRVLAEGNADAEGPITLVIELAEQPYVIGIEFEGLEHIRASTVRDTVKLRAGAPYNPARAVAAKAMVRQLLANKGFRVRRLEHRLLEVPDRPGEFRLVFEVEEGQRLAIAEIEFEGNEVFSDEELRGAMSTKAEGFFWFRPGTLDEDELRTDLRATLPAYYGERGYIDFAVTGDTLVADPVTGKGRLVVSVSEGPQYALASFQIEGNKRFPADELRRYFEQERGGLLRGLGLGGGGTAQATGSVFDRTAFLDATERVRKLYHNQGYLYAQVQPDVERTSTEDGSPAVNVTWNIREGQPAYINRVTILGNTFTHERVIRERILLLPGDVYNEELLIQSYQNVMALGFFESPLPMPRMEPNESGDVDITFEVKEKQTGSINFGTALGGGTGLAGFLGYDQPNLFGQAKSGHLRWEFGRWSNNFEASYSDPSVRGSRVSGSVSLFSARDRFFRFSEGQRRRTGAGLRFGLPLPNDRWSRLVVGYSLSRTTYQEFGGAASTLFSLPPGVQSTVTLGLNRNTLNHPLFPTSGTRQELEASLSGGLLGGDGDFQKYTATGSWYVPVAQVGGGQPGSRPIRFTLGLSAEAGALVGDASAFPFDRFWMGGVQFGRPLRGYEETTVTPRGYFPRGAPSILLEDRLGDAYLRLSAEYAIRFNDNLSVSAFYDAGNLWREPGDINPTRLRRGAGLGVTLVTPFGPLGLDYAYGFDKDVPGWQLHFKLGPGF